jgi:TPR repeat protein
MLKAFDASQRDYQLSLLEDAADGGDTGAQLRLGDVYRFGQGGQAADPVKACDAWSLAKAAAGSAAHDLAQCFYDGVGRPQDYAAARALYQKAVELGFGGSRCALGNMLIRGLGGPRDVSRGIDLCRAAAGAGDANAQTDLGDYYMGAGGILPPDMIQARGWYEKAAVQGQAKAAFNLAVIYWNGDGGVDADRSQAARWWRFAYEHGRGDAARYLGDWAYLRYQSAGGANTALLDEAIDWYQKAAAGASGADARADAQAALDAARAIRSRSRPR